MPDLLIRNARLPGAGGAVVDLTITAAHITSVTAMGAVCRDGRASAPISAHGAHSAGEVVDAGGRWVVPGLWDEHVHFDQWASSRRRIDLASARSAAQAAAIVAAQAPRTARDDGLVVGRSFRDALWPDAPHRALLDAVVPDRPVVLVSADLHCCWLNSAALTRFGAESATGLLREEAGFAVLRRLDEAEPAQRDDWALRAARAAAARGVVGVHDLEMGDCLDDWRRRMDAGFDLLRVEAGIYAPGLDRAEAEGLSTGLAFGPLLTVGRFKTITDGSLGTRTAYCVDPYPDLDGHDTHDHGVLAVGPEELREQLRRATAIGLEPAVHAIGDEANRLALDAMIELGTGGRIEHAQLLRDPDVARFAAGGIAASIQPEHAMDDRDIADRYWPGRTRRGFLIRSLLNAGVRVRFGSDAPVAALDPWHAIAAAVLRSRDGRAPWHPEQAITAAEAIACSTRTEIRAGEPADLVLLDADPLGDPAALRDMPVAATLLGGRWTHRVL